MAFVTSLIFISQLLLFAAAMGEGKSGGMIVFDTSGSMNWRGMAMIMGQASAKTTPMVGESRMDHAKRIANDTAQGFADKGLDMSLIAFGTTGCDGIDLWVKFGGVDPKNSVNRAISQAAPHGPTPIAAALRRATEYIKSSGVKAREVVLITDGLENCKGDPVAAARALREQTGAKLKVIGLDIDGAAEAQLREVAIEGGGIYEGISAVGAGGDRVEAGGGKDVSFEQPGSSPSPNLPTLLMPPGFGSPIKDGSRPFY